MYYYLVDIGHTMTEYNRGITHIHYAAVARVSFFGLVAQIRLSRFLIKSTYLLQNIHISQY